MSKLRIKLDFCNNSPLVWTFCDLKTTKTVKDLTKEIEKKHECKKVQLMLEDAILPPQEPIGLLENGDIIKIVKFKKRKRKISSSSSASENEIPVSATKNGVKKEKKNVKNEATESDDDGDKSDNETYEQPFKRSKLEVKGKFIQKPVQIEPKESLQTNNIENEKTKDKKRKRKRKNKNKNKLNLSEKEVEGIPTVLPLENNPVPASTPTLPNHGKRTVFNDSSDSDKESKSLNISNGNGQKLESEDMSEKTATVDENNVSMDVSSPIVNGKTKKLAPNQKSISCEDFLLEAENCEKPNLKLKPKTNGFNALLSLADNPIKAKRIAQKDVYSSKSVVLTNTNDKNLEFGDIDQYPALEDDPNEGQTLAFKYLQIGPDYTPQYFQYVGELIHFNESTKCGKFLVLFDENEGKSRLNKFEIDEVIEGQTKRNQEIEFSFSFMQDVKLVKNST